MQPLALKRLLRQLKKFMVMAAMIASTGKLVICAPFRSSILCGQFGGADVIDLERDSVDFS